MAWTIDDIPSLTGKNAIVTGSTDGLGREVASRLAAKGAMVVVAGRNAERGRAAAKELARASFLPLDLADLASVRAFAAEVSTRIPKLDILVNNAGVGHIPERRQTKDGFEMQMGVNYLGHFALTAALLPVLLASGTARVVNVSSLAHLSGKMDFDDLLFERHYRFAPPYSRSKLAMLLFALELDRRAKAKAWPLTALAAHPGVAASNLTKAGPSIGRDGLPPLAAVSDFIVKVIQQSTAAGALPILRAATDPQASGGQYYGPDSWFGTRGAPVAVTPGAVALDRESASRLWTMAEQLTGARW